MFTVEFEDEDTIITSLDDTGEHEDTEVILDRDGTVWIRQFFEEFNAYHVITMSRHQFEDILSAWNKTEGAYVRKAG